MRVWMDVIRLCWHGRAFMIWKGLRWCFALFHPACSLPASQSTLLQPLWRRSRGHHAGTPWPGQGLCQSYSAQLQLLGLKASRHREMLACPCCKERLLLRWMRLNCGQGPPNLRSRASRRTRGQIHPALWWRGVPLRSPHVRAARLHLQAAAMG